MDAANLFDAQAFNRTFPNGRSRGHLTVFHDGLRFEGGGQSVLLPFAGLQLKLGGAGNRLIFLSHARHPDWQFYTADHGFLTHAGLREQPFVQDLVRVRRSHRRRNWGAILAAIVLLALFPLAAYLSLDAFSAIVARKLPDEWENSLGKTAIKQYQIQKEFLPDRESEALLRPLISPLLAQTQDHRRYRFYVVDDSSLNAFALPGGYIVVHSGLILKAKSADQLQGVLAHEIAHVTEQHGVRSVIRSVGIYAIVQALIGDATGLVAVAASAAPMLINQKYSRDFEREADRKGMDYLYGAKINPAGLVHFFVTIRDLEKRQLEKMGNKQAGAAARTAMEYLGTHPDTDERIAMLQKRIRKQGAQPWRDDRKFFSALQKRVQQFVSKPTENRQ